MKIIILGSGVVGVASAWYLAKAGHEVTVLDRQPGPALETSFGNAGEISPGYASPWAAPGIPTKALKWLFMEHSPLILRPPFNLATARWLYAMLRNCSPERYAVNKERMVRVAEWSRDCLRELRAETGISYDERMQGTLQLFREQSQMDGIAKDIEVLAAGQVSYELLDRAQCIAAEPGLGHSGVPIIGGLRLPNDETGDCFKFTGALATLCEGLGVSFRYDCHISRLVADAGKISGVDTGGEVLHADSFLVALGSYSPAMVRPLGLHLPICPVKGYSITVPIADAGKAPVSTLLDESYKVAITRLGDRIRVGGMAAIAGFDKSLSQRPRTTLELSVGSLFPGAGDLAAASYWSGLRPMTPDSTPIIGPTAFPNLYLNTGHGTLGWTMACGSGQVIADIISGRAPEIETRDLALSRY